MFECILHYVIPVKKFYPCVEIKHNDIATERTGIQTHVTPLIYVF